MSSTEGTLWLRQLLMESGQAEGAVKDVSTRSLKTTLLSWVAKASVLTPQQRRVLGHHVDREERSRLTYARDSHIELQAPLFNLLGKIKKGEFDPDAPAALRLAQLLGRDATPPQKAAVNLAEAEESDSEDEVGECQLRPSSLPEVDVRLVGPRATWRAHILSDVVHLLKQTSFRCGRLSTSNYREVGPEENLRTVVFCKVCGQSA